MFSFHFYAANLHKIFELYARNYKKVKTIPYFSFCSGLQDEKTFTSPLSYFLHPLHLVTTESYGYEIVSAKSDSMFTTFIVAKGGDHFVHPYVSPRKSDMRFHFLINSETQTCPRDLKKIANLQSDAREKTWSL